MTDVAAVRFQRTNLVVRDLDRALAIYRDVLGFEVDYQKTSAPDSYSYRVFGFPPEAVLRTQDGRVGREAGFLDPDGHLVVVFPITAGG